MDSAARSFGLYSESYEKSRPLYSSDAVDFIVKKFSLTSDSKILELGAGTGKFTTALVNKNFKPVVNDWCSKMLEVLSKKYPYLETVIANANSLPLEENGFDIVVAAQSFHWFATKDALREIFRVLKPHGYLVIIFQERVAKTDWMQEFHKILYSYPYDVRARFELGAWQKVFDDQDFFGNLEHENFPYTQYLAKEDLVHRALGMSFLAALPEDKRDNAITKIKNLYSTHVELFEKEIIEFFYNTHIYWLRAL